MASAVTSKILRIEVASNCIENPCDVTAVVCKAAARDSSCFIWFFFFQQGFKDQGSTSDATKNEIKSYMR